MTISRRIFAAGAAGLAAAALAAGPAVAQAKDSLVIAWPQDVPNWDPNSRTSPAIQSLYMMVYDQPMTQTPDLKIVPNIITAYQWSADYLALTLTFRNDVTFHNGDKLTAEDFRYTFFERIQKKHAIDIARIWRPEVIKDIEVKSPTEAVIHFHKPMPTAIPWLTFLASFIVPKAYMEKVGVEEFYKKPIGSGPYKIADYQPGSRIVLQAHDKYWGGAPKIKNITIEVVKEPAARVAAVQAGRVDMAVEVPVREAERLATVKGLKSEIQPITSIILLQLRADGLFADPNVRLAAHHAVDKDALSKAFFAGKAVPLYVFATPGTPGHVADFKIPYDEAKARQLLENAGYGAQKPLKVKMASTNGAFPGDYEIARAVTAMWKKIGIEAEIEVIEQAKYFELNRANKLPEATVYSWGNATGDPEMFAGYLLNPNLPFSAFKEPDIGARVTKLFTTANYDERIKGYRDLVVYTGQKGGPIPLLQTVGTVVFKEDLNYVKYDNFWIQPHKMSWK